MNDGDNEENVHTYFDAFFVAKLFGMLNNRIINFHQTNQSFSTAIQIAYFYTGGKICAVSDEPSQRHFHSLTHSNSFTFFLAHVYLFVLNLSTEKLLRLHKND